MNPNTNCLANMACPQCKSYGPFDIEVKKWMTMHDDGSEESEDGTEEWGDDSRCHCLNCDYTAKVKDFADT